tara:strand:+ start:643 stop:1536 length:894 start_codon:yes stop_codon:yes gene_type:complete
MKVHEEKNIRGRSESTCGYCRKKGHNQYSCAQVKKDWKFWNTFTVPNDGQKVTAVGWYGYHPQSWGQWYEHCKKTHDEIIRREKSKAAGTSVHSTRATPKCGFCEDEGHNRRNCSLMKSFLKDCNKANENWRKAAYSEMVEKHGFSVGSVIKVRFKAGYWDAEEKGSFTGVVTKINWETLTVFTKLKDKHMEAHSPLKVDVMLSNGETVQLNGAGLESFFRCIGKSASPRYHYNPSGGYIFDKVIAPASQKLDASWVTGYNEAFKTLAKKRNYTYLRQGNPSDYRTVDLVAHINAWK